MVCGAGLGLREKVKNKAAIKVGQGLGFRGLGPLRVLLIP